MKTENTNLAATEPVKQVQTIKTELAAELAAKLDAIVVARLFGARPWLADSESCAALQRMIMQMGLEEQVPGEKDTWQSTSLGKQIHLDVIMVFLGLWESWDMIYQLEEYGLIAESDAAQLYDQLAAGVDPESVLRGPVQRAYLDYYSLSKFRQ